MMLRSRVIFSISLLLVSFVSQAATVVGTLPVTSTVTAACVLGTIVPINFASYSSLSSTATTTTGSITITCTNGASYNLGLDQGQGVGASANNPRIMTVTGLGIGTLNYSLFQDAAFSVVWGNTIGTNTLAGTGTGLPTTKTVYASIAAGQTAPPGSYKDSVTITATF